MFSALRFIFDLASTADRAPRGQRVKVNTPKARRARLATAAAGQRPANVSPEAWAYVQKITAQRGR